MSWVCAPLISWSKCQGNNALITENGFVLTTAFPSHHYRHETLHTDTLWVKNVPYRFRSQNVKGQSQLIDYWEWSMTYNRFPFTYIVIKFKTRTPLESTMCPIDSGVKRSRSQYLLKVVPVYNCFPFTPIVMQHYTTLHTDSTWVKVVPPWFQDQKSRS